MLMGQHGAEREAAAPEAAVPGQREIESGFPGQPSRRLLGRPAETRVAGSNDRLSPVLDLDLVEDMGDVVAHGLLRQIEPRGDLGVVEALRDEIEDLALARRERRE